jgi:hypothetical protein
LEAIEEPMLERLLARDPKRIANLLPRPAALSSKSNASRFDLLGQSVQRTDCPEADCGIVELGERS